MTRAAKRGGGSPAVLVAAIDPDTHAKTFHAPDAAPPRHLAHTSAIVHMLESAGGTLRVHPTDASSLYRLLPPDEAAWVVEVAGRRHRGRCPARAASCSGCLPSAAGSTTGSCGPPTFTSSRRWARPPGWPWGGCG